MQTSDSQRATRRRFLRLLPCVGFVLGLIPPLLSTSLATPSISESDRMTWRQVETLVFPRVSFTDATLAEILSFVQMESRRLSREASGVRIRCKPAFLPSEMTNVVTLSLTNISLHEMLSYVTRLLDLEWTVAGGEVVISRVTAESKARALLEAATAGDAEAQFDLGFSLWQAKNYAESAKWMRRAADQGNPPAQTMLGMLYADGNGVAQSHFEAVKWYSKAAGSGDSYAQMFLAYAYSEGRGVSRNHEEAARLMGDAAAKQNHHAQAALGWWYVNGINVDVDLDRGMKFLREAAAQGNEDAIGYIAKVETASSTVFLSQPVEFPATINGRTVGVTTAPSGSAVKVIKREAGKVCVQYQEGDPVWIDQFAVSADPPVKDPQQ